MSPRQEAEALTNQELAHRLELFRDRRRNFTKAEADAFLTEASKRLRWADVYEAHRSDGGAA